MTLEILTENDNKLIEVNDSKVTLFDILRDNGINISSDCGGNGTCKKCEVYIKDIDRNVLACEVTSEWLSKYDSLTIEIGNAVNHRSMKIEGVGDCSSDSSGELSIAIDIGTTTICFALVDIYSGNVIDSSGSINSQRKFGSDVISRIKLASSGNQDALRKCIIDDIVQGVNAICTNNGTHLNDIKLVTIAGNTTMCHILMGYDCSGLGVYPYTPVDIDTIVTGTKELLGIDVNVPVVIPPGFSTYVGADITSGLIALDPKADETFLLVDLGTNGEMVLGKEDELFITSTAAGPAFEGGNISCGVPSIEGAISHVSIDGAKDSSAKISFETIGKKSPIGICGSGLLDIVYEIKKNELIDETGVLVDKYFKNGFKLYKDIRITQDDIRQFQMAKAAVRAGLEILLKEASLEYEDINNLYIAGGFGTGIDIKKAVGVGLIPSELINSAHAVGNTSIGGVIKLASLLGREIVDNTFDIEKVRLKELDMLQSKVNEIDLSRHDDFKEMYMQYMNI